MVQFACSPSWLTVPSRAKLKDFVSEIVIIIIIIISDFIHPYMYIVAYELFASYFKPDASTSSRKLTVLHVHCRKYFTMVAAALGPYCSPQAGVGLEMICLSIQ